MKEKKKAGQKRNFVLLDLENLDIHSILRASSQHNFIVVEPQYRLRDQHLDHRLHHHERVERTCGEGQIGDPPNVAQRSLHAVALKAVIIENILNLLAHRRNMGLLRFNSTSDGALKSCVRRWTSIGALSPPFSPAHWSPRAASGPSRATRVVRGDQPVEERGPADNATDGERADSDARGGGSRRRWVGEYGVWLPQLIMSKVASGFGCGRGRGLGVAYGLTVCTGLFGVGRLVVVA